MRRLPLSLEPGDISARLAAERMGLSEAAFREALSELLKRGFPQPDPTTGNFDFQAIEQWRRQRHVNTQSHPYEALDARGFVSGQIAAAFGRG